MGGEISPDRKASRGPIKERSKRGCNSNRPPIAHRPTSWKKTPKVRKIGFESPSRRFNINFFYSTRRLRCQSRERASRRRGRGSHRCTRSNAADRDAVSIEHRAGAHRRPPGDVHEGLRHELQLLSRRNGAEHVSQPFEALANRRKNLSFLPRHLSALQTATGVISGSALSPSRFSLLTPTRTRSLFAASILFSSSLTTPLR